MLFRVYVVVRDAYVTDIDRDPIHPHHIRAITGNGSSDNPIFLSTDNGLNFEPEHTLSATARLRSLAHTPDGTPWVVGFDEDQTQVWHLQAQWERITLDPDFYKNLQCAATETAEEGAPRSGCCTVCTKEIELR